MTFEERLDRLTERHEALTQSGEILLRHSQVNAESIRLLVKNSQADGENIRALARIAEIHERRITRLEGGE